MERKNILFFLDLEGTILNEKTGDFEEENLNKLLKEIDELEKCTDAKVNIHIVSPILSEQVEQIVDKIDTTIMRYNRENNKKLNIIEGATAYFTDGSLFKIRDDRISKFPESDRLVADGGASGKKKYVQSWCEVYGDKALMSIYCGNGRNDIQAMEYIKKTKNGLVVCPKNSRTKVRKISDFTSEKTDINGTIEGLEVIVNTIKNKKEMQVEDKEKIIEREIELNEDER